MNGNSASDRMQDLATKPNPELQHDLLAKLVSIQQERVGAT